MLLGQSCVALLNPRSLRPAPRLDLTLADENAGLVTGSGSVVKFK